MRDTRLTPVTKGKRIGAADCRREAEDGANEILYSFY